jgi:hypothetical protein
MNDITSIIGGLGFFLSVFLLIYKRTRSPKGKKNTIFYIFTVVICAGVFIAPVYNLLVYSIRDDDTTESSPLDIPKIEPVNYTVVYFTENNGTYEWELHYTIADFSHVIPNFVINTTDLVEIYLQTIIFADKKIYVNCSQDITKTSFISFITDIYLTNETDVVFSHRIIVDGFGMSYNTIIKNIDIFWRN